MAKLVHIRQCQSVEEFSDFIENLAPTIGFFGGRFFKSESGILVVKKPKYYRMNQIVRKFSNILRNSNPRSKTKATNCLAQINAHDKKGHALLAKANYPRKVITYVKRFFGNLFYNRSRVKKDILGMIQAIPKKKQVSFNPQVEVIEFNKDEPPEDILNKDTTRKRL